MLVTASISYNDATVASSSERLNPSLLQMAGQRVTTSF